MSSSIGGNASRESGRERFTPNILLLGWISLLTDISSRMILPILPLFLADALGAGGKVIGMIEGIGAGISWGLKLLSGWLSDRWGRRKPFVFGGYLLSNLAKPLLAFTAHWGHILVLRSADKFGSGLRDAPRDALIADSVQGAVLGRAFGYQKSMDKVGALLGTALAFGILAFSSEVDYRPIFLLSAIPGLAGTVLVLKLREAHPVASAHKFQLALSLKNFDRQLQALLLVFFVFNLAGLSYMFFFLRVRDLLGIAGAGSPKGAVLNTISLYFWYSLSFMAGASFAGRISDKVARWKVLGTGFVFFGLAAGGLAFNPTIWQVWALLLLYGLSEACTTTVARALISDLAPPQKKGTTLGAYYAVEGLAGLAASPLAGWLWDTWSPQGTFSFAAGLAFLATVMLVRIFKKKPLVKEGL